MSYMDDNLDEWSAGLEEQWDRFQDKDDDFEDEDEQSEVGFEQQVRQVAPQTVLLAEIEDLKRKLKELKIFVRWIAEDLKLENTNSEDIGDFYDATSKLRKLSKQSAQRRGC